DRQAVLNAGSRLDLDEAQRVAVARPDVALPRRGAPVAPQPRVAVLAEPGRGAFFGGITARPVVGRTVEALAFVHGRRVTAASSASPAACPRARCPSRPAASGCGRPPRSRPASAPRAARRPATGSPR